MNQISQQTDQIGVLLPPDAVERSLQGVVLSRLLAETGLDLAAARFVALDQGRGLAFLLQGDTAAERTAPLVGALCRQLAADVAVARPEAMAEWADAEPSGRGEQTLVLLKPDNFEVPSIRAGALLDHFARTGLTLAWMGVRHMSVAEAERFYGPVLPQLKEIFRQTHGAAAIRFLEQEYGETLPEADRQALQSGIGPIMARLRWERLVEFMTGRRPSDTPTEEKARPGARKCLALIYRGENAVTRIRDILGPTDPAKAPAGTVRREFGRALMINAAHASDSVENARRECEILGIRPADTGNGRKTASLSF